MVFEGLSIIFLNSYLLTYRIFLFVCLIRAKEGRGEPTLPCCVFLLPCMNPVCIEFFFKPKNWLSNHGKN